MSQPEPLTEQQLDETTARTAAGSWGVYEYGNDGSVTDITAEVRRLRAGHAASEATTAPLAASQPSEAPVEPESPAEAPTPLQGDSAHPIADADNPTQLRWGLDDVLWGDDDSVIVLLSGPDLEPYWLELEPERAAVLRRNLAGPKGEEATR